LRLFKGIACPRRRGLFLDEVVDRDKMAAHGVACGRTITSGNRVNDRAMEGGLLLCITDEYRAVRPRTVSDAQVVPVIERTLNIRPKAATHWSIRSMAAEAGLSHTTIRRIWGAFGLQPHRSE
jgi:hypothetical protein